MSGWFGKKGKQGHDPWQGGAAGRSPASDRAAKRATLFVLLSVLAAWMMSGLFVLKENQQATIFRLGKFHRMARVGLNWTLPYPIESHDIPVLAESVSTVIGNAATVPQSGLRSEQLLTAYAHNRKILVKENQTVRQGQRIAEMGSSGTDRVKLHFEVRRDGNAVDPMPYLPKP